MEQLTPLEGRQPSNEGSSFGPFLSEWMDTSIFPTRTNKSATADHNTGPEKVNSTTLDTRSVAVESGEAKETEGKPNGDTTRLARKASDYEKNEASHDNSSADLDFTDRVSGIALDPTSDILTDSQAPSTTGPHPKDQRPAGGTPPNPEPDRDVPVPEPPQGRQRDIILPIPPLPPVMPPPIPAPLPPPGGAVPGPMPGVPSIEPYQPRPKYTLPDRTNPFLPTEEQVKDAHIPLPLRESIQKWINELEDDRYSVREQAQKKLTECPNAIGPIMDRIKELKGKPGFLEQKTYLPIILQDQNTAKLERLKTDLLSEDKNERTAAYKTILRAQGYDFIAERLVPEMREALNAEKDPKRRTDLQRTLDYMNECSDGCELDRNCRVSRVFHPGTSKEAFRINYEGTSSTIQSVVFPDRMFATHFGGIAELRAPGGWFDSLAKPLTKEAKPLDLPGQNGSVNLREHGLALSTDSGMHFVCFDWENHRGLSQRLGLGP